MAAKDKDAGAGASLMGASECVQYSIIQTPKYSYVAARGLQPLVAGSGMTNARGVPCRYLGFLAKESNFSGKPPAKAVAAAAAPAAPAVPAAPVAAVKPAAAAASPMDRLSREVAAPPVAEPANGESKKSAFFRSANAPARRATIPPAAPARRATRPARG
jgi:hypothetical protein